MLHTCPTHIIQHKYSSHVRSHAGTEPGDPTGGAAARAVRGDQRLRPPRDHRGTPPAGASRFPSLSRFLPLSLSLSCFLPLCLLLSSSFYLSLLLSLCFLSLCTLVRCSWRPTPSPTPRPQRRSCSRCLSLPLSWFLITLFKKSLILCF